MIPKTWERTNLSHLKPNDEVNLEADIIAKYIERYRWIAWIGLVVILFVAGKMIYDGLVHHELGVLRYLA